MTPAIAILLLTLVIVSWTDYRDHRVPNSITYPAFVGCLMLRRLDGGFEAVGDGVLGALVGGGALLLPWIYKAIGGGDVKLAAVMGAALGWHDTLHALMWTFVFAAIITLSWSIWKYDLAGTWRLLRWSTHRAEAGLTEDDPLLPWPIYLGPAALAAVLLILADRHGVLSPIH